MALGSLVCMISFCVFLLLAIVALGVCIFTDRKAYMAFILSMVSALIVWSLSHLV